MSIATIRLTKELAKLGSAKDDILEVIEDWPEKLNCQITIKKPTDLFTWELKIKGPTDSPYETGIFDILVRFDSDYPVKAPSVKFLNPPFHPNIYRDGKICIDILQPHEWVSTQTIRTIMLSIISLLCDPNPASPANREAAELYVANKEEYVKRVKLSIK